MKIRILSWGANTIPSPEASITPSPLNGGLTVTCQGMAAGRNHTLEDFFQQFGGSHQEKQSTAQAGKAQAEAQGEVVLIPEPQAGDKLPLPITVRGPQAGLVYAITTLVQAHLVTA